MKAEMLEQDVELELARNWHQKGCEKSLHRLVNAYMRLAVSGIEIRQIRSRHE